MNISKQKSIRLRNGPLGNVKVLAPNVTLVEHGSNQILYSYNTPVAILSPSGMYKTSQKWSKTTSRHINRFFEISGLDARGAMELPQEVIESYATSGVDPISQRGGNPRRRSPRHELTVFDKRWLEIARRTLRMPDAMVGVMGGMSKMEAREIVRELTGARPGEEEENPRRPRRTRRRMGLLREMAFFRAHGGGIVGQAAKGALDLARAEREMEKRDWVVLWEPDEDADLSWMTDEERAQEHEVYCAVLVAPTKRTGSTTSDVLASLCGIVDPSREYKRVVEAELALEALSERR